MPRSSVAVGRKPYGFRPGESEVIARIKEVRNAGAGLEKIADQLNAEVIQPRKRRRWWAKSVSNTLSAA